MMLFPTCLRRARFVGLLFGVVLLLANFLSADVPTSLTPDIEPPEVLEKAEPVYPKTMVVYKTVGLVIIQVIVDENGLPMQPRVLQCNHYEFESPGIEAALKWKFKPARKLGVPVAAPFTIILTFNIVGGGAHDYVKTWAPFVIPPVSPKDYAPEFQYDHPPQLLLHCRVVYPRELLIKNAKGSATVSFLVDPSGRPRRIEVVESKQPEFAAATRAMVGEWRFRPASKNGAPTWTTLAYKMWFDKAHRDTPFSPATADILAELKKASPAILPDARQLDRVPRQLYRVEPTVPDAIRTARRSAGAEIEFILDSEGRVQLPKVVSATDEEFGWSAATAVTRWLYEPPTQGGQQVNVFMRAKLDYIPPPEGSR